VTGSTSWSTSGPSKDAPMRRRPAVRTRRLAGRPPPRASRPIPRVNAAHDDEATRLTAADVPDMLALCSCSADRARPKAGNRSRPTGARLRDHTQHRSRSLIRHGSKHAAPAARESTNSTRSESPVSGAERGMVGRIRPRSALSGAERPRVISVALQWDQWAAAQRPSSFAASTSAWPGGRIRPALVNAATLAMLTLLQRLFGLRGVYFCR